jgi:hypothetical protein
LVVGDALGSYAIDVFGTVCVVALVIAWAYVLVMTVRGVVKKEVLWKDRGEDREEGGFKRPVEQRERGGGEEIGEGDRAREGEEERAKRRPIIHKGG